MLQLPIQTDTLKLQSIVVVCHTGIEYWMLRGVGTMASHSVADDGLMTWGMGELRDTLLDKTTLYSR